jgi:photosystem II oxygen-evolving enhancer protein 1
MRFRALLVAFLALCLGVLTACSDAPSAVLNRNELTYDEILNTGLANKCPQISEFTRGTLPLESGESYVVTDLCLEPQEYFVKGEPINKREAATFIQGKLLTRDTTSLEQMTATLTVGEDGVLTLKEEDGIDFQPITVQLPGGERVPLFFTSSINSSTDFEGDFKVPSYRGAGFLDPKGRGVVTGYDNAVALPASADSQDFQRANVKATELGKGTMSLQVTKVDASTGEFAGVFESEQPSDTDLGAKDAEEVKIRGIFYGRLEARA